MNGSLASENVDDPNLTDYSLGKDVIYASFAWSVAEKSYKYMLQKAKKNHVGFFDVSSDNGYILFPHEKEGFIPIEKIEKPWWKFW